LTVVPLAGYTPSLGDGWPIISSGSFSGQFSSLTAGYSVQQLGNTLMLYFGNAPPIEQPGDENGDGNVDAADYVALRKMGATPADYQTWRENFGEGTVGGGADSASVPEPAGWMLILWGSAAALPRRRPICGFSELFCKNSSLAEMPA
jgi:hypothetical protein